MSHRRESDGRKVAAIAQMNPLSQQNDRTRLATETTGALGAMEILHPAGTFAPSPASVIAVRAIAENQKLLAGIGIDWGCGTGCLAIAAARIAAVRNVVGLDIVEANVASARSNAASNGVAEKTEFMVSDSYTPASAADCRRLDSLRGKVDFIVANPPASAGDDGFGYRRVVLEGAQAFLSAGGVVFLNISLQYGPERLTRLVEDVPGFLHRRAIASTAWVPFDLSRPDLLECLEEYAREESRGGLEYSFTSADLAGSEMMNARSALAHFRDSGQSPLSKWQTHLFEFDRFVVHET
jgi:SAM-dependent methyltransferase